MQMAYLDFVQERHNVWWQRQLGKPEPWTGDPVLLRYKFTNVFRLLDHGTQFLLEMLQEDDLKPGDQLFRAFLYRHTGRPEPWEFFHLMHGRYPKIADLELARETFREYRGPAKVRTRRSDPKNAGRETQTDYPRSVFTGAYLVFPQSTTPGTDKLDSILDLTKRLFHGPLLGEFFSAKAQSTRFTALQRHKGVADFMSMQILTDFGYTTEDRENAFIVPGPGAIKGAKVLFPTRKPGDVIHWAHEQIAQLDVTLEGRRPSLMDVQNTLCEFSKYARYMERPLPDRRYAPAHPGPQPDLRLPTAWKDFS
jgi:hypothetical protein